MNIPSQSGQASAAGNDYQSLSAARAATKSTFAQTIAQSQSASLSLTTAEGDLVTLSGLSLSYQYTQGIGWFSPASSGVTLSGSSASAQALGLSVQGDLNEQELADITRLVTELTAIASDFFSGDQANAITKAMDLGDLGSVASLSASFSRETVSRTRIASEQTLPAMAALNDLHLRDLYETLGSAAEAPDYAAVLEARWQQILKALEEMKAEELDGLMARREEQQSLASVPPPVVPGQAPPPELAVPAEEQAARRIMAHLEQFLGDHPKLSPFAGPLAATAMEKAAAGTEQPQADTARALAALRNAFRNRLQQWLLPPELPAAGPLTEA